MLSASSDYKLNRARNPRPTTFRVRVPRGTKKVYIPRQKHYRPTVMAEDHWRLERFYDILEPCIVKRGLNGFGVHRCPFHTVLIEEVQ